jgi:hypothetical protein
LILIGNQQGLRQQILEAGSPRSPQRGSACIPRSFLTEDIAIVRITMTVAGAINVIPEPARRHWSGPAEVCHEFFSFDTSVNAVL